MFHRREFLKSAAFSPIGELFKLKNDNAEALNLCSYKFFIYFKTILNENAWQIFNDSAYAKVVNSHTFLGFSPGTLRFYAYQTWCDIGQEFKKVNGKVSRHVVILSDHDHFIVNIMINRSGWPEPSASIDFGKFIPKNFIHSLPE